MFTGLKLYAAIGVGGMLVLVGAYQAGINAERKRGEAAQLRVELETLRLDKALAEKALLSAADKGVQLEAEVQLNEEALDALRKTLAARSESERDRASGADLDNYHWGP